MWVLSACTQIIVVFKPLVTQNLLNGNNIHPVPVEIGGSEMGRNRCGDKGGR
jgi:hypothetical protein